MLGQIIQRAVEETGRRAVYVASGDLSHKLQSYGPYGFAEEGPQYDARIMDVCGRGAFGELFDFDEDFCDRAAECGHRSFVIMAGALDGAAVEATPLSHEDVTGVGYGICTFYPKGLDDSRSFLNAGNKSEDPFVRLARASLERYVREHQVISVPEGLPAELTQRRAGAFVSIHKHGQLRGCIGTIAPTRESLAEEIIHNAISASTRDPRFYPVTPEELDDLEINVDVLGEPEEIRSESAPSENADILPDGIYSANFETDSSMFCVNEADEGKGLKFPKALRGYLTYVVPVIMLVILIVGYWEKFF